MKNSYLLSFWRSLWVWHHQTIRVLKFSLPAGTDSRTYSPAKSKDPNEDPKIPLFSKRQQIGLPLGPILFIITLFFLSPEGLSYEGRAVLATTLWVATWWVTEAIPIPATSLLPIILFPLTNSLEMDLTTSAYGGQIIFLILGGFCIAIAMEKWNVQKRIAMFIISLVGDSTQRLILGFMSATAFLSLWISNSAAVMMVIPIGTALLAQVTQSFKDNPIENGEVEIKNFEKLIIFAIGYSGTIGGIGTLIGTNSNVVLAGFVREFYGIEISFLDWMIFGIPLVVVLLISTWLYLTKFAFPVSFKSLPGGKEVIANEKKKLGKVSFEEKAVLIVFFGTAFLWVTRSFIWNDFIPGLNDATIAIIAAVTLFIIPSMANRGKPLLGWEAAKDIPWGVLLLIGAGLALARGFTESGLSDWFGSQLGFLEGMNILLVIIISAALVLFFTELTSNAATASLVLPILATVAVSIDVHPYVLIITAGIAANFAFMMPIGTPPNAIMYATGKVTLSNMIRVGFWLNIFTLIFIVFFTYLYLPYIWGFDVNVHP